MLTQKLYSTANCLIFEMFYFEFLHTEELFLKPRYDHKMQYQSLRGKKKYLLMIHSIWSIYSDAPTVEDLVWWGGGGGSVLWSLGALKLVVY